MHGMYSLIRGYQPKPKKKYRIPRIYSTELKKVSKLKCPNEDPPHPLSPTWKRKESNHKYGGMEGSGKENGLGGYWGVKK